MRRALCTSARGPLLPKWGFFGKTSEDLAKLEQAVREDGNRQAAVVRQLAVVGLKAQAMITQPMRYFRCESGVRRGPTCFPASSSHTCHLRDSLSHTPSSPSACSDAEWRQGWMESLAEPLERYSRINDRLLDGCEAAYTAIADEFHADAPDWQPLVESGAIEPELVTLLEEARAKWTAAGCGRRPPSIAQLTSGSAPLLRCSVAADSHRCGLRCDPLTHAALTHTQLPRLARCFLMVVH